MLLTVETGPLAGTVVTLKRDHPTLLGSGSDCALRIQEAGVIEQHAVVKALKGKGFGIKALGVVRVNGSEVQASPLADGDVIEIGTTRIAFGQTQQRGLPTISGYRIIDVLGKGGMGTVYRAEQVSLHRQVALKVLKQEQTSDPAFIAQFVAEARAAAKLQHPNVVSVFDVEHDGDTYYYAMELMHEGSCEDWLKQNGVMPVDRAMQVVADAAAGLAYAESLGIVHRDIKPDNLMLDQHGAIKIADLGLASTASEAVDERAVGTPHFMAPEQVLNKALDHRADLYALGCTFYRLITGKTPFRGQTVKDILRAQVKDNAEPASRANAAVPAEVTAIIQRLMAKDPGDRYQTANELLEELQTLLQPPQKRGMWIGLATAAVIVAGGTTWWAMTRPDTIKTIENTVVFDDPQTQQFADRIKVLEAEAKQKDATIAFLTVLRVPPVADGRIAAALDQVASQNPDTTAASEAQQLAATIRTEVAARERALAEHRTRIAEHLAKVRRATMQPLDAFDFALAIRALDLKPQSNLIGDEELMAAIEKLHGEIVGKARERLKALRAPVAAAQTANDEAKLASALKDLDLGLQPDTRWPQDVLTELAAAKADAQLAHTALSSFQKLRRASIWQSYHNMLQAERGFSSHVSTCDFTTAAQSIVAFANDAPKGEAKARAEALAVCTKRADTFALALEQACNDGQLRVTIGQQTMQVVRWDRQSREFTIKTTNRRRNKEQQVRCDDLQLAHWLTLASQVPLAKVATGQAAGAPATGAMPGDRECFVGLLAVNRHRVAATAYLGLLSKTGDNTGTGDNAYALTGDIFEQLLDGLSESGLANGGQLATKSAWSTMLNDELQAGKRLAAGLRALSEKRNLAAAGHIEKLLADHPHSILVAVLP